MCFKKMRIDNRQKRSKNLIFKKYKKAIEQGNHKGKIESEADLKKEEAEINMKKIRTNMSTLNNSGTSKQQKI